MFSFNRIIPWMILTAALTSACGAELKSKMSVKVAKGKPKPGESSKLIEEGKSWFQTREMITMNIAPGVLKFGDVYTVVNETTKKTLIDKQVVGVNLAGDDDGTMSLGDNYQIQVRFFPKAMSDYEDFTYGANSVKFLIEDKSKPVFQKDALTITDFDAMGVAAIGFDTQTQMDDGYQSWLNSSTTINGLAYSRTIDTTITTGYFNIINPSDN